MKAYKSPLVLNNFFLLNHQYHFIQPPNDDFDDTSSVIEIIEQYELDIDFTFQSIDENTFQLFTKININNTNKPFPGYLIFIEGVCVFTFDTSSDLSERDKSDLLYVSGLNICINSLRNIIATTTANGPIGKYTLPSINVNKLLSDKQSQIESNRKHNQ